MNNYTVLRDGTVRLVGIPALGILIPNVTGLVTNRFYRPIESAGNYFIGNIYEILFLNREKEQNESRVAQLNTAKAQAELEALKNQIDPHFIFNSLNTLSFLITRDPKKSAIRSPVQRSASETSITATNSLQKGISSLKITLNRLQSSYRSSGFDTIAGLDCNN